MFKIKDHKFKVTTENLYGHMYLVKVFVDGDFLFEYKVKTQEGNIQEVEEDKVKALFSYSGRWYETNNCDKDEITDWLSWNNYMATCDDDNAMKAWKWVGDNFSEEDLTPEYCEFYLDFWVNWFSLDINGCERVDRTKVKQAVDDILQTYSIDTNTFKNNHIQVDRVGLYNNIHDSFCCKEPPSGAYESAFFVVGCAHVKIDNCDYRWLDDYIIMPKIFECIINTLRIDFSKMIPHAVEKCLILWSECNGLSQSECEDRLRDIWNATQIEIEPYVYDGYNVCKEIQ